MNARCWTAIPLALLLSGCPKSAPKPSAVARNAGPVVVASESPREAAPAPVASAIPSNLGTAEYWIQRLGHPDPDQRERAARALSRRGVRGIAEIAEALRHSDPLARATAARVLQLMGPISEEIVPLLLEALKDPDARVRVSAAQALGEMGLLGEPALPDLIYALNDQNAEVAREAELAMEKIQGR